MNIDNIKATTDAFLDCNLDEYSFCERLKLQRRLIIEIERTVSSMRCEPEWFAYNFDKLNEYFRVAMFKSRKNAKNDDALCFIIEDSRLYRTRGINGLYGNYYEINHESTLILQELSSIILKIDDLLSLERCSNSSPAPTEHIKVFLLEYGIENKNIEHSYKKYVTQLEKELEEQEIIMMKCASDTRQEDYYDFLNKKLGKMKSKPETVKHKVSDIKVNTFSGELHIDALNGQVLFNEDKIDFNPVSREFKVLLMLAKSAGQFVKYKDLECDTKSQKRNLGFAIRNVKKMLKILPEKNRINEDIFENKKNFGYILKNHNKTTQ